MDDQPPVETNYFRIFTQLLKEESEPSDKSIINPWESFKDLPDSLNYELDVFDDDLILKIDNHEQKIDNHDEQSEVLYRKVDSLEKVIADRAHILSSIGIIQDVT